MSNPNPFFGPDETPQAVVAIDLADNDNLELIIAILVAMYGPENVHVVATGRRALPPEVVQARVAEIKEAGGDPFAALKHEWDKMYSEQLLELSVLRYWRALVPYHADSMSIYHGGIAPVIGVPHMVHADDSRFPLLSENDHIAVDAGTLYTRPLSELAAKLRGKPFVVFLGGPATGIDLLLSEHPELWSELRGSFAQYAMFDGEQGMVWAGRAVGVQFNVLLDPGAGARYHNGLRERNIPSYWLPTNVTRVPAAIGFADPRFFDGLLEPSFANMVLAEQRRAWYWAAIEKRPGEALLTHDLATIFLYLQLTGELPQVYETKPANLTHFETAGESAGAIAFDFVDTESWLTVATKLVSRTVYLNAVREHLRVWDEPVRHVVICGSLESNATKELEEQFRAAVINAVRTHLQLGHHVHWGSHPSMQEVMQLFAQEYLLQLHQHILTRFAEGSRIADLPETQVYVYPSLLELRKHMLADKDFAVFLHGRLDAENRTQGFSGVLVEYVGVRVLSPQVVIERHTALGGAVGLIAAMESVAVLTTMLAEIPSMQAQLGALLLETGKKQM
jgi:hypothetical protein